MLADSKKISIRQANILLLTVLFSPSIRLVPTYTARHARQAAWLAPIFACSVLLIIVLVMQGLFRKYKDSSLIDVYTSISGKFIGKALAYLHLVWIIMLLGLYTRYFAIRLLGSIMPYINLTLFIVTMLLVVAYLLRTSPGIETLARINEIIFPFLVFIFYLLFLMVTPHLDIDKLTPISYRDIIPAAKSSYALIALISYYTFIFIIGDKINNKENIKKIGVKTTVFILVSWIVLIVMTVGTLTYSIIQRSPLPLFITIKQINLFNTFEKIESVAISFWIMSDFVLISFFAILALRLMKSCFSYNEEKHLVNILLVFAAVFALYITGSAFELEKLSINFFIPGNIIFGFVIPILMLIVGKIRKKI